MAKTRSHLGRLKSLFSTSTCYWPSALLGQPIAVPVFFLPSTAAPTTPGPSSSELAALVFSMRRSMTLQRQQFSELATLIRPLLAALVTTTASVFRAPAADPLVPWSSISATVPLPSPGTVGGGVLSTAPPQALAIAAEALGLAPASVGSGSGDTSLPSLSLASRHRSRRFNRAPWRANPTQQEQKQRSPSAVCPAIFSCACLAVVHCYVGVRSAASVKTRVIRGRGWAWCPPKSRR